MRLKSGFSMIRVDSFGAAALLAPIPHVKKQKTSLYL
jgi:hypothetical protein